MKQLSCAIAVSIVMNIAVAEELRIGLISPAIDGKATLDQNVLKSMKMNGYNYVMVPIDEGSLFWNWRAAGNASVSPWMLSGTNEGQLTSTGTPNGRDFLKGLMVNAFKQANDYGMKVIPKVSLGAHGTDFALASSQISWNHRRFDPTKANPPLLKGGGGLMGLVDSDIGTPSIKGSGAMNRFLQNAEVTVAGSGADIWGTADQFHYVFTQFNTTTCAISGHLRSSLTNTNAYAKAGVMVRGTMANNSVYVGVFQTPSNSIMMHARTSTGGAAIQIGATVTSSTTRYLRVRRTGSDFFGEQSVDGSTWTLIGRVTIGSMPPVYALGGLAVTSHNNSQMATAVFNSVGALGAATSTVCTPFRPDANFDAVLVDFLRTWRLALDEAKATGKTVQAGIDYVHFQHDEDVTGPDLKDPTTAKDYLMIGEAGVDRAWLQANLATANMQALVPMMMGQEISRRLGQARAPDIFGPSCKAMIYGDMWDCEHTGGQSIKNYVTTQLVQTCKVLDDATALSVKNDIIIMPWQYDRSRYYQYGDYDTRNALTQFTSRGYSFNIGVATNSWPNPQLDEWVKYAKTAEHSPGYMGYSSLYFPGVVSSTTLLCVFPYAAQLFNYFASITQ